MLQPVYSNAYNKRRSTVYRADALIQSELRRTFPSYCIKIRVVLQCFHIGLLLLYCTKSVFTFIQTYKLLTKKLLYGII
nr:MAG TPA: hypothetical protein [Caudoviricetes sp.]